MAELQIQNVGHVLRAMLSQSVYGFLPGPRAHSAVRMAMSFRGQRLYGAEHWAMRRYAEVEALHQANVSVQVHAFIHRVLWLRWTDQGVAVLSRALHIWCNAIVACVSCMNNCVPGVEARALYAVQVAAYLDEHEDLDTPPTITVKLMEVPKLGQPGLGVGGAALITEKKLIVEGQYNVLNMTASETASIQQ